MSDIVAEILTLMDAADRALDKDAYDQFRKEEMDLPDDCEVWVQAETVRKCWRLFAAITKLRNIAKVAE